MKLIDTGKPVAMLGVGVRSMGLKFLVEKVARASIRISPVPYELSGHSNARAPSR
ncbi:hypothetical protein D3C76_1489310 [compost metagenome]